MKLKRPIQADAEVCILAGGLSTRMGRDKARLRLGRRTLLGHVRAAAKATGLPVRVIREDRVKRCGPLGGIFTALATTQCDGVLFVSCDMPFVTARTISETWRKMPDRGLAVFYCDEGGRAGFPFALRRATLRSVESQLQAGEFSLQRLAKKLQAKLVAIPARRRGEWFNVNTPDDFSKARMKAKMGAKNKTRTPGIFRPDFA